MSSEIYEKLKQENYMIGIPSRNRSSFLEKRRGIWKYIDPTKTDYPLCLCIRCLEHPVYRPYIDRFREVLEIADLLNISDKRNTLLEEAIIKGKKYLFIIDDDVVFGYRDESLSSKYKGSIEEFRKKDAFNKLLYECIQLCSAKFPIVGLPLRQGSQSIKYMFPKNIPIIRFVCYHVPTLIKENIKINAMNSAFMSDRYVHLSLLSKGYRSLSNARFSVDDSGTGYKGGCSETRTSELQSEAAKELQKLFPDNVSLKYKDNGSWKSKRIDCTIAWRKFLVKEEKPYLLKEAGLDIIGVENAEI